MAYPDPEQERDVNQRYHMYEDLQHPAFTKLQLDLLDRDFMIFCKDAGIVIGDDRKVPVSGGVPRIFVMGLDAQGVEKPMTLEEAGLDLKPNNPKLWQQVSMGNVFVYPAGADHPVQLQADSSSTKLNAGFAYSKPVPPAQMPERQVKRPGLFARIMNAISGGRLYKAEFAAYNNQRDQTMKMELQSKLAAMSVSRETSKDDELIIAQEAVRAHEKKLHQRALDNELKKAQNSVNAAKLGYENLRSVYKPVPEKKDYLIKDPSKNTEGMYLEENFNSIKVFSKDELDLSKIIIAPKGKIGPAASEKDFCAVAMFTGMHYEIAEKARINSPQLPPQDIHAVSSMQRNLGLTEAQARQVAIDDQNGMYTEDMFIVPKGRDNCGQYFKVGVNMARQQTADAFNAYKNGDKEPLAKLLAFGIDRACNKMVSLGSVPGDSAKGIMQMGVQLSSMMNKDPELKALAMKNGMTEKQFKSVEAMNDYLKLDEERKNAELKLAEAAAKGTDISPEEKRSCMKAIVKARLVDNIWLNEAKVENDKTREIENKMIGNMEMMEQEQQDLWKMHPEQRPAPPEGKFWMDTASNMFIYAQRLYRPIPPVIGTLKNQASMDEIVDRMIDEDKVETKSCEELGKLYSKQSSLPQRSIQIAEDLKNEKELGLDENININAELKAGEKKADAKQADDYDIDLDKNLDIDALQGRKPVQAGPQL